MYIYKTYGLFCLVWVLQLIRWIGLILTLHVENAKEPIIANQIFHILIKYILARETQVYYV